MISIVHPGCNVNQYKVTSKILNLNVSINKQCTVRTIPIQY